MGVILHANRKRDVDAEKHLKRWHKTVPLIESPLTGADHQSLVFSQRHEANTVELFFDLFFAANLATFTTYHSITDSRNLSGYIGFFGILWSAWFQVTLHDVRFARDSIYERICKTVQFIVFVGLALVGSGFNPGGAKASNQNFRILCYTLVISRGLFCIQYIVVLFFTARARYSKLYLPLSLMVIIYALGAIAFGAMTPAFQQEEKAHRGIYTVWYAVMGFESVAVITISCFWKMLSFKKTHLMERMSLLTLIVIGEGAIGVTKTVSRMMGKSGLDVESCFLVMCIITVLVFLWAIYFDNFPHGHYGTIRQQLWSLLHFPFQLAIVGVVEGSQQIALARYVNKNYDKIDKTFSVACLTDNLDGAALRDKLVPLVEYFQFESKLETYVYDSYGKDYVYQMGNDTGICSPANVTYYWQDMYNNVPVSMHNFVYYLTEGMYMGLGIKLPVDKLYTKSSIEIAIDSWWVVYVYYWSSFILLIICSTIFMLLIRRHKADVFDRVSIIVRLLAIAIGGCLIALVANEDRLYSFLNTPFILPICLILLFLIQVFDRISATFSNWRLKKSGEPYAFEDRDGHHGGKHGEVVMNDPMGEPLVPDHRKSSAAWSLHSDREPLTGDIAYHPPETYPMGPLASPPAGYAPVHHGYGQV